MDYSTEYQPQPQVAAQTQPAYDQSTYTQYQYQQQQQSTSTDPSQIQAYDPSTYTQQYQPQSTDPSQTQAAYDPSTFYTYQDYNQQQYYYPPSQDYYTNATYQQQQAEPASIYPPGVPIPPSSSDPYPTHQQQQQQYSYYPQQQQQAINYAEVATVTVPNVSSHTPATVQSSYRGKGKRGGRSYRGGTHGHLGGGQPQPSYAIPSRAEDQPKFFQGTSQIQGGPSLVKPSSSALGSSASVQPPPRMVWCELCRVECNTPEVLEVHKNGKKHKKKLKAHEELQKLNKLMDGRHSDQTSNSEFKPRVCNQPEVEGYGQLPKGHLPSGIVTGDRQPQPLENLPSIAVIEKDGSITGKQKVEEAAPVEEVARAQGRGQKRMLRGGRGGKMMKSHNGSRKPAVPPKPKKMVPLICELCNVTCESVVVFQSHLAGKKHLSNLKDFQDQQAMVGQAALQALYPALQALYPALQALCQPNTGASTSVAPHQPNLHEILGILTQQALSTIPQHQVLGVGTAATSALPPPSELEGQDHQVSKFQVISADEPLRFAEMRENAAAEDVVNRDLSVLQNTGSKPEENTDNKLENMNLEFERKVMSADEPLRFAASVGVPSSGAVVAAVSVSNSEVVSSDCAAHAGSDGKLVD